MMGSSPRRRTSSCPGCLPLSPIRTGWRPCASPRATAGPGAPRSSRMRGCPSPRPLSPTSCASFDGATGWLNSPPLTPADLRGKVVLVDFWTYTCINWLRQLPYVRAWAEKYADQGLVVIGVHTPEFPFEKDADNVRQAVQDMRV